MTLSGVRPIMVLASAPTASILLSCSDTATTDGSFRTIPFPGRKTRVFAVPKSMPSLLLNMPMCKQYYTKLSKVESTYRLEANVDYRSYPNKKRLWQEWPFLLLVRFDGRREYRQNTFKR